MKTPLQVLLGAPINTENAIAEDCLLSAILRLNTLGASTERPLLPSRPCSSASELKGPGAGGSAGGSCGRMPEMLWTHPQRFLLCLGKVAASRWDAPRQMDVVIVRSSRAHGQKAPVTGSCIHSGQPRRGVLRRRAIRILRTQATAGLVEITFRLCHLRFVFLSEQVESASGRPPFSRRRRGRDPSARRPAERFCRSQPETTAPCKHSSRAASRLSSQHARRLWPSPW